MIQREFPSGPIQDEILFVSLSHQTDQADLSAALKDSLRRRYVPVIDNGHRRTYVTRQ